MARPKGLPELESGFVRHEVWKRVARYLENHPKDDIDIVSKICLPIVLKMLPEKIEGEGFTNPIVQIVIKESDASDVKSRLQQLTGSSQL